MDSTRFQFYDPGTLADGELVLRLIERNPGNPDNGIVPEYKFEMRRPGEPECVGAIHLRVRLTPRLAQFGGHIGYEVKEHFRGHHYAARSCRLLFPLARMHGINPILLTCAEDNAASRRTCELAGGRLVAIRLVENELGVLRSTCYYHVVTGRVESVSQGTVPHTRHT